MKYSMGVLAFLVIILFSALNWAEEAEKTGKTYLIEVTDQGRFMVDKSLSVFIENTLERTKDADLIILEIDTYGGVLASAFEIRQTLMEAVASGRRIAAYIPIKAVSAGAMITVSCPEIVMLEGAHFGDCAPVMQTQEGLKMLNENDKITSVLRKDFETACKKYGYPYRLGHAMVSQNFATYVLYEDSRIKLYSYDEFESLDPAEREKISGGDIPARTEFFFPAELARFLAQDKDEDNTGLAPETEEPIHMIVDEVFEVDGRRLAFMTQTTGGRKDFTALSAAEEQYIKEEFLKQIDDEEQMVELSAEEAYNYHFASKVVTSREEMFAHFNVTEADVIVIQPSRSETLLRWLNSPAILGLLIMVGIVGIYVEINTPGFGIGGMTALAAFGAFFLVSFLVGEPQLLPIILFVAGIILVLLEIFVIPGFGVAGISGILLILGGLMLVRLPHDFFDTSHTMDWRIDQIMQPFLIVLGGFFAGFAGIFVAARYLPESKLFAKYVVKPPEDSGSPNVGSPDVAHRPVEINENDEGDALTDLRPSGKITLADRTLTAVSNGEYIPKGSKVKVIKVKGNQVIVEKA